MYLITSKILVAKTKLDFGDYFFRLAIRGSSTSPADDVTLKGEGILDDVTLKGGGGT